MHRYMHLTPNKQLSKVNFYLNQFLPQYDGVAQDEADYWASPKEFLITGSGDCEDYAIIKYFSLIKLGFDKDKLFLATVVEKLQGGYHMVLAYFKHRGKAPLILDNLSFRILNLKKRDDLSLLFLTNTTGVYNVQKVGSRYELIKIKKSSLKFDSLLSKIEREN